MHFYCTCGYRISDTSDFLSFKASVLSNQDEEDYVDGIEALVKEESLCPGEQWERIFMEKMLRCLRRNLYQCPHCGRLHRCQEMFGDGSLIWLYPESLCQSLTNTEVDAHSQSLD